MMESILHIETSGKRCSVALSWEGELIGVKELEEEHYVHSEHLHLLINALLEEYNTNPKELKAVMVSEGPGSYTGLRIGVASAKGMCYALDIPLMTMSSVELLFESVASTKDGALYCSMIDARRMEVYAQLFDHEGTVLEPLQPIIVDEGFMSRYNSAEIVCIGDGAEKGMEVLSERFMFDGKPNLSAANMVKKAWRKFEQKDFVDLAYFEPNYLKEFQVGKPKKLL